MASSMPGLYAQNLFAHRYPVRRMVHEQGNIALIGLAGDGSPFSAALVVAKASVTTGEPANNFLAAICFTSAFPFSPSCTLACSSCADHASISALVTPGLNPSGSLHIRGHSST